MFSRGVPAPRSAPWETRRPPAEPRGATGSGPIFASSLWLMTLSLGGDRNPVPPHPRVGSPEAARLGFHREPAVLLLRASSAFTGPGVCSLAPHPAPAPPFPSLGSGRKLAFLLGRLPSHPRSPALLPGPAHLPALGRLLPPHPSHPGPEVTRADHTPASCSLTRPCHQPCHSLVGWFPRSQCKLR